jgi:hypothetical protein
MMTFLSRSERLTVFALGLGLAVSLTGAVPASAQSACATAGPGEGWVNKVFDLAVGRTFTASFDATPAASPIDGAGYVGLSLGAQKGLTGFASIVRFNGDGSIDARNGGTYAAAATIPYTAGVTYHFRLVVNVPTHTYAIFVTPGNGAELTVGAGFAFRSEQGAINGLDRYGIFVPPGSKDDTLTVCHFAIIAPALSCVTADAGTGFQGRPFPTQSAAFTAEWDSTPSASGMNASVGLSRGWQDAASGFPTFVRFNSAGTIDVRDGGRYTAAAIVPYTAGATYHFRAFIDPAHHRYSVAVTTPGGSEQVLAAGARFRTGELVGSLDSWAAVASTPGGADLAVCGWEIRPDPQ